MKTIAQELEERLFYLADPKVKWVRGNPHLPREACLMYNARIGFGPMVGLRFSTLCWLDKFVKDYANTLAVHFNDHRAKSRQEVLWMLEEAVDQAKWEGV